MMPSASLAFTAVAITAATWTGAVGGSTARAADDKSAGVQVIVAKATTACFSDRVRIAGFLVPQSVALGTVDAEGFKITELLASEGDMVTLGQTLARLTRVGGGAASAAQGAQQQSASTLPSNVVLKSPAAGLVIGRSAMVGSIASMQGEPLFRIMVDNKIELEVEVPSIHLPKLKPGAPARVAVESGSELNGRVRLVSGEIDRRGQLGRVRLSLDNDPTLRIGMFASASIDASRSCGASIPRSAVLYRTDGTAVQIVRDGKIETRAVRIGLVSDTSIEIRDGIREGDTVVANAGTSLRDGDVVTTIVADDSEQARAR
jgi:multidrug efflux pump subunit AcrA (membrane-fusion protein)